MARRRTLTLSPEQQHELTTLRDYTKDEYVRERCAALLKIASGRSPHYLDGYIVGRAKVIAMYQHILQRYSWAERIYVAQDNWNIHQHDDVFAALKTMPTIEPV